MASPQPSRATPNPRALCLLALAVLSCNAASAETHVAVIGDSLAVGWPEMLAAEHPELSVRNSSVIGSTAGAWLSTVSALTRPNSAWEMRHRQDHLIISLGTNDASRAVPLAKFRAAISFILLYLRDHADKIHFLLVPTETGNVNHRTLRPLYWQYLLDEVCAKNEQFHCLDLRDMPLEFFSPDPSTGLRRVHTSREGNEWIARRVMEAIQ